MTRRAHARNSARGLSRQPALEDATRLSEEVVACPEGVRRDCRRCRCAGRLHEVDARRRDFVPSAEFFGGRPQDARDRAAGRRRAAAGSSCGASTCGRSTGNCSTAAPRRSPGTRWKRRSGPRQGDSLLAKAPRGAEARALRRRRPCKSNLDKPADAVGIRALSCRCAKSWKSRFARRSSSGRDGPGRRATWSTTKWAACCRFPAGATSSRSRSSTASRCSRPACAPTSASRCSAPTWRRSTASARRSKPRSSRSTASRDVIAAPIMGKGYIDIQIDREEAARYGISVEDIQNEIEVALGRPGRDVHRREARPVSRPHPLRPRQPRGRGEHPPPAHQSARHERGRLQARDARGCHGVASAIGRRARQRHIAVNDGSTARTSSRHPHAARQTAADSARPPSPTCGSSKARR